MEPDLLLRAHNAIGDVLRQPRTTREVGSGIDRLRGQSIDRPAGRTLVEMAAKALARAKSSGEVVDTDSRSLSLVLSALWEDELRAPPIRIDRENIPAGGQYQGRDPRWLLSAIERLISRRAPFITHKSAQDFTFTLPERPLRLAILGDWGTGAAVSAAIAAAAAAWQPDLSIHLGDVYYSGTRIEIRQKFLSMWPTGLLGSVALNSNHEMYCGGTGYFEETLRDPRFREMQAASYASLANSAWQIVALDSAYFAGERHDPGLRGFVNDELFQYGRLGAAQAGWLSGQAADSRQRGRRLIILSHHNPVNANGTSDTEFLEEVATALAPASSAIWYFGHEHLGIRYRPLSREGLLLYPRCVGHGGVPYWPEPQTQQMEWMESDLVDSAVPNVKQLRNGFLTLELPTSTDLPVIETFRDQNGKVRQEAGFSLPSPG